MKNHGRSLLSWITVVGILFLGVPVEGRQAADPPLPNLPEGNTGIASRYQSDNGIERDPAVLLTENFESGLDRWNHWGGAKIAQEAERVHGGMGALEMTLIPPAAGGASGVAITRNYTGAGWMAVPPGPDTSGQGFDVLFVRYYLKLEKNMDMLGHNHASCSISAHGSNWEAGIPADGRNKYVICFEPSRGDDKIRPPGEWNIYSYHPEQRSQWGDHFFPNGQIWPLADNAKNLFGDRFVPRPKIVPERDRWNCYELMVKANTPGKRDGRIAYWIDGRLSGDFPNLRLRDVPTLKINHVSFGMYTANSKGAVCTMWFDDVVVATSYIGPILKRKKSGPAKSVEEMAKAHEALAKGDLALAWRHLEKVDSDELFREAQEGMRKIEEVVNGRLREAQALEAIGEKSDAVGAYREILQEFSGVPAAERAKARIEALRTKPNR